MNPDDINVFLENMTLQSEKEIERIRAEGEAQIREFERNAESELARYMDELAKEERTYIEETIAMERNRWALEYRRRELLRFEVFLDERIDEAVKSFRATSHGDYETWMREILGEILEETGAVPVEIIISPDDGYLSERLVDEYAMRGGKAEDCRITTAASATRGGVRVHCADKPVEYDCTVERILFRIHDEIRLSVSDIVESRKESVSGEGGGN